MRLAPPLALAALLLALPAAAQTPGTCAPGTATGNLDASDVRARLFNTGSLFFGAGSQAAYIVPAADSVSAIFAANLWVTAAVSSELRTTAATYHAFEMWPGPLDAKATLADCSAYDRVWVVSAADVAADEAGGAPTADLVAWPVGLGAPAVDASGAPITPTGRAQTLDLAAGERPVVYGAQTAFWVMNDVGNAHTYTGSAPLGLEVQAAAFAVASPEAALNQATFYRYRLVNRASHTLADARAGLWVDADLGEGGDDYLAADTARGMLVFYNADDFDENPPGYGYGAHPPAIEIDVLSGAGSVVWLLKSCSTPYCSPGRGQAKPVEYARLLHGLWRDGTPITEGGLGYQTAGPVVTSTFPGAPEAGSYWSMRCLESPACGTPYNPSDQRGVVSSAGFALAPGEAHDVTFAVVYARGADYLDSVARLRAASDRVQAAYDDGSLWQTVVTASEAAPSPLDGFALAAPAPNPASGAVTLAFTTGATGRVRVTVYDALGRTVTVVSDGSARRAPTPRRSTRAGSRPGRTSWCWRRRAPGGRSASPWRVSARAPRARGTARTAGSRCG